MGGGHEPLASLLRPLDVHGVLDRGRLLPEELPRSRRQDPQIEPERPVGDVPEVLLDSLRPFDLVAPVDLRPAGDAWKDVEPSAVVLAVVRSLLDEIGSRPDEAHLTANDVQELRQLVQARPPQKATATRNSRILGHEPEGVLGQLLSASDLDRIRDHRSELQHRERPPEAAGARVHEEDGPPAVHENPPHHDGEQRRQEDEEDEREDAVEHLLGEPLNPHARPSFRRST